MPTCVCGSNAEYVGLNEIENCSNPDCKWYGSNTELAPTEPPAADDGLSRVIKPGTFINAINQNGDAFPIKHVDHEAEIVASFAKKFLASE